MKLCDVNIFINAHRAEYPDHRFYREWLEDLIGRAETYLYCEWILSAFVRIVTHPKIFKTPSPLSLALQFADQIRSQPNAVGIMPGARHWGIFDGLCRQTEAAANLVPDAYLAALAIEAGADWVTADKGFAVFEPQLSWRLLRP